MKNKNYVDARFVGDTYLHKNFSNVESPIR